MESVKVTACLGLARRYSLPMGRVKVERSPVQHTCEGTRPFLRAEGKILLSAMGR